MDFVAAHRDLLAGLSLLRIHLSYLGWEATRIAAESRYDLRATLVALLKAAVASLLHSAPSWA